MKWDWKKFQFNYYYHSYDEYLKYTSEQFLADPLTAIFSILRISDSLKNTINSETSTTKTSTATLENTFTGYSYNGNDTFNISLDLQPLTQDVRAMNVAIKHNELMELTGLDASVNFIGILDLKLNATLQTQNTPYGVKEEVEAQRTSASYK